MKTKMTNVALIVLACLLGLGALSSGGEVGNSVEVAPQVGKTQMQSFPEAAWAADSKSWLVVWREGYINEEATDVLGGRVSADGKALDPAGIPVCRAKDRQEHAVVASDGRGWLVVWEDFRNGKDYDVYAARVSGDGKLLDPDGFVVAGGEHNQCWPAVVYAGGNYVVVWQAFVGETPDGTKGKDGVVSGYRIFGTAVSPEGKVLTPNGSAALSPADIANALRPVAAADETGKRALIAFNVIGTKPQGNNIGTLWVDGATGKGGETFCTRPVGDDKSDKIMDGTPIAASWGKGGGVILANTYKNATDFSAVRVDASGARAWPAVGEVKEHLSGFLPRYSIACDGESYLLTRDIHVSTKPVQVLGVKALRLPADWKGGDLNQGWFDIAGDGKRSCLMGHAAAGPKGAFLVTYTEARGVEDVKVMARIVK